MKTSNVLLLVLSVILVSEIVYAEVAFFEFADYRDKFIFELRDPTKILEARKILKGEESDATHVMGRIKKTSSPYNNKWSWTLDPDTISFFSMAIEVCDASINYVEEHLDEACGAFLPGCFYCPWSSKLVREVPKEEVLKKL